MGMFKKDFLISFMLLTLLQWEDVKLSLGRKPGPLSKFVIWIRYLVLNFVSSWLTSLSGASYLANNKWVLPTHSFEKVNVDGNCSFNLLSHKMRVSSLVCDAVGRWLRGFFSLLWSGWLYPRWTSYGEGWVDLYSGPWF